jgi:N-acetylneuraminate synthase
MNSLFNNLLIFEIANNHQGDVSHARYIIQKIGETVRMYGLNAAVKLQYRDLDTLVHPNLRPPLGDISANKHVMRFYNTRLSDDAMLALVDEIHKQKLIAMCTPFDEFSVEKCITHDIDILKIASCSALDWPLLHKAIETQKPIAVSTGGKTFSDMDELYNLLVNSQSDFAMLHCVGAYPMKNRQAQLYCIKRMINRYSKATIGYSGHECPDNLAIVQMAVAMGACVFERHVGHATEKYGLNGYSTEVDHIGRWIAAILTAKEICGDPHCKITDTDEIKSLNELSRGTYCANPIQKGTRITRQDVFFAMPCVDRQISSGQFSQGTIATRDYIINDAIADSSTSPTHPTRSEITDIWELLMDAKVVIGKSYEIELSHHYGIERFREVGVAIVNIINREYCKKIIAVFPFQKHPTHYHKIKEETFHVLYGVLDLIINGREVRLRMGDLITIERGVQHSFTSQEGCVFEEVSTTHIIGDSYYADESISQTEIAKRKTIVKNGE